MHFGASQRQISIHTGVAYLSNRKIPFSSFSDTLDHGPASIWAHLTPILKHLRNVHGVTKINFLSDGPTTQYRCRNNFYLLASVAFELGFQHTTWNFLEAGHGKRAPDGIGAAIKRQADAYVNVQGHDIMTASDLIRGISATTIKLFDVSHDDISHYEQKLNLTVKGVPNTMKIHQIISSEKNVIHSRVLSCFCAELTCQCYSPVKTSFGSVVPVVPSESHHDVSVVSQDHVETPQMPISKGKHDQLEKVDMIDESLIGRYVVVLYDGIPFPGVILGVDEDDIEVKAMHRVGNNRYFWPLIDDVLWYHHKRIITLLPAEPEPVTSRHCQIPPAVWKLIEKALDA